MTTDLLTLALPTNVAPSAPDGVTPGALHPSDAEALAVLYLASYPPGVAASNLDEARTEMHETFGGAYGRLRADASATAWADGRLAGAVMVVERSVWDPGLEGPFVIELFVDPAVRGRGVARALMSHAVATCSAAGDPSLSLRTGEGTSPAAHALYAALGFAPLGAAPGR